MHCNIVDLGDKRKIASIMIHNRNSVIDKLYKQKYNCSYEAKFSNQFPDQSKSHPHQLFSVSSTCAKLL